MTGGYLARVAESGMTSMGDVRGSIPGTQGERNSEEQRVAAPFTRDEHEDMASEPTYAVREPQSEARLDPRNPAMGAPPDATAQPDIAPHNAPTMHVHPLAPPAVDGPPGTSIEERWSVETVSMLSEARHTGADAPSLKDAGIRSVGGGVSRDEMPSAREANRQREVLFDVTVQPFARAAGDDDVDQRALSRPGHSSSEEEAQPSTPLGVSAARVEQWRRLKDRLLLEHYHGGPEGPPLRSATSNEEHSASQPTNVKSTSREIVIEQLEVVVAASHPASPLPVSGRSSRPPRSGAWSVATRRYLGKL